MTPNKKKGRAMSAQKILSVWHSIEIRLWLLSYRLEESRAAHANAGYLLSEAKCCIGLVALRLIGGRYV